MEDLNRQYIVSFNKGEEVFERIKLPDFNGLDHGKDREIALIRESLSVIVCEYGVYESWTKLFTNDKTMAGRNSNVFCTILEP